MANVKYVKIVNGGYSTANAASDDLSINTATLATSLSTPLIDRAGAIGIGTTDGTTVTLGRAGQVVTVNSTLDAGTIDRAGVINVGTTSATAVNIGRAGQATSVGGTLNSVGNFSVNTTYFTVDAATGNTVVAGTLESGGAATLDSVITTDIDSATVLNIGTGTATSIIAGKAGVDFDIKGNLIVRGVETLVGGTAFGSALILNEFAQATVGTTTQPSCALQTRYSYWNGSAAVQSAGYTLKTVPGSNAAGTGALQFFDADTTLRAQLQPGSSEFDVDAVDALSGGALTIGANNATSVAIGEGGIVTTILGTANIATLDRAGTIDIGRTNGTSIGISRVGQTTRIYGDLVVDGVFSGAAGSSSTIILQGGTAAFTADTGGVTASYLTYISSSDKLSHADAAAIGTSYVIGFADVTAASGASVKPIHVGVVTPVKPAIESWGAGDVGKPVYLASGADAGKVTKSIPTTGILLRVGYIKDHTAGTMLISFGEPTDLGA